MILHEFISHNSLPSKKPIHNIRAKFFLQASSAKTTTVRGQKNCFQVGSHKQVTLCHYVIFKKLLGLPTGILPPIYAGSWLSNERRS